MVDLSFFFFESCPRSLSKQCLLMSYWVELNDIVASTYKDSEFREGNFFLSVYTTFLIRS
jgi:hypothetical protein